MTNGNQTRTDNYFSNAPQTALALPFTAQVLADFSALDYSVAIKPILDSLILTAAQMCIDYTQRDLLQRDWIYKIDRNPETQRQFGGVSISPARLADWVRLPIGPVNSITSVKVDGTLTTDYQRDGQRLVLPGKYGKIEIAYKAGYTVIPEIMLTGVKMLAVYLYERRGACDIGDAITASGAAAILRSQCIYGGGL